MLTILESGELDFDGNYMGYILYDHHSACWYHYYSGETGRLCTTRDFVVNTLLDWLLGNPIVDYGLAKTLTDPV